MAASLVVSHLVNVLGFCPSTSALSFDNGDSRSKQNQKIVSNCKGDDARFRQQLVIFSIHKESNQKQQEDAVFLCGVPSGEVHPTKTMDGHSVLPDQTKYDWRPTCRAPWIHASQAHARPATPSRDWDEQNPPARSLRPSGSNYVD